MWKTYIMIRPEFFYQLIYGIFFFRFRVGGQKKEKKKKSSENDQLTEFQRIFFFISRTSKIKFSCLYLN